MNSVKEILSDTDTGEKYWRPLKRVRNGKIDVYSVLEIFDITSPPMHNCIKKILFPGVRGSKDEIKDLKEALNNIARRIEDLEEDDKDYICGTCGNSFLFNNLCDPSPSKATFTCQSCLDKKHSKVQPGK